MSKASESNELCDTHGLSDTNDKEKTTMEEVSTSAVEPPVEKIREEVTDEMKQAVLKKMHSQAGTAAVKLEFMDFTKVGNTFVKKCQPTNEATDIVEPPSKRSKKNRGRNKHRPRDERPNPKENICQFIATNRDCKFAEKCTFTHDVKVYFANKLPDIAKKCYNFETYGKCPFGLACRFSGQHTREDYSTIVDEEKFNRESKNLTLSVLNPEVKSKLRKKMYKFPNADSYLDILNKSKMDHERKYQLSSPKKGTLQRSKESKGVAFIGSEAALDAASTAATDLAPVKLEDGVTPLQRSEEFKGVALIGSEAALDAASTAATEPVSVKLEEGVTPVPVLKKTVKFNDKLYLAPLTTVGNLPFRRVCKGLGADITCGEMAMCTNLLQGHPSEWALLKRHVSEDVFGVQICGSFPDTMAKCTELINNEVNVDFIDINVGCPIDLVFKKGAGSALMCRLSKFEEIVRGMVEVSDVPITVKMRAGVDDRVFTAHKIIPKVLDWGASLVTVHGRTREQRYTRAADWDYLEQCASLCGPKPFLGNGDIFSFEDLNMQKARTGMSSVMIARGALIKPWIFTEIKEQRHWDISSSERFSILQDFTNFGLEHWGSDQQGVDKTRRFMLEWLSFLYRYIPVGVLERVPQRINERPPHYLGRDDLETLMASPDCRDWVKISEMLLGPVPSSFQFLPKHKANSYS
ncbi:tRNA-dihydrouridine(47) synthase [NAD(P)(+)]-like [Antedon mediterranea]|uniref:tRNA-dihydrouridine(47) synthase [NAD(P)(+)]-like n=1 Tax=Antedon mediterranea TaxID=105859 RepID=UPI003AF6426A